MTEEKHIKGQGEMIDDLFAQSRTKIDLIIQMLSEKLSGSIEKMELTPDNVDLMGSYLDHLEKLIKMRHMNMAKTKDLKHFEPKKYQQMVDDNATLKNDHEILEDLKPIRDAHRKDETNFPKRGPRGPREDVAPPPEEP